MKRRAKAQKAPAYQWYPKDFMSDGAAMAMTLEQQGLYRFLLDVCWLENGLPMRPHELWRIGRCDSLDHFEQLWPLIAPKFYEKDGRWHHKRLDDERKKQAKNRKQRHLAAERRWELERQSRNAAALREQYIASSSPTASAAPASKQKEPRPEAVDHARDLADLWNATTQAPLPRCTEVNDDRKRKANARLREHPLEHWRAVFARIDASAFCKGENDRGWVADFDFAIKPGTGAKVLEGKYDDRRRGGTERAFTAAERQHAERVRKSSGGCRHEPPCESWGACLETIMRYAREKQGAA